MSPRTKAFSGIVAGAALLILAVVVGLVAVRYRAGSGEAFALEEQAPRTIELYRYVDGAHELADAIPCYCGCGGSLGHTSLLDCFIRPDGSGFEPHASFCAICTDEAELARALADRRLDRQEIRASIDREFSKYGAPTITS